ncbi:MAG: RNA polymerase sigma-70 factor [Prolixibacteraceae bacterium]
MSRATPDISDDCMLINELKGGSSRAFDMIFRKYYDNLCRFTFSMLGDADLSQELVQNVFIKLWERRFVCGKIDNLAGYLTTMTKHQVFDYNHDHRNQHQEIKKGDRLIADESTENEILRNNFEECLVSALAKLPGRCREAFELSRFQNLTNKEIAGKMDITVKGVEALIGRALKTLRIELSEFLPSYRLKDNLIFFFSYVTLISSEPGMVKS